MNRQESSYESCKKVIQEQVREQLDLSRELTDEEIQELIDEELLQKSRQYTLSLREKRNLGKEVFDTIRKLDILQELIEDESVTEIMVNGTDAIFIEKEGRLIKWEKSFDKQENIENIIQQIVAKCNRSVNEASPIVDARLENGARVHIILPPVALNGPIITIRRFPKEPVTMERLLAYGSITEEAVQFLKKLVASGYNIFISGGTGSGKTTFLNALSHAIPNTERIITIEDAAELQLQDIPNLVRLETRNSTTEGTREITIRDLIKASLRMRPDRIIVGEVRGKEAIDMLQALNTGHDGSISTGHANSTKDMLLRLETMVLMDETMQMPLEAIRRQIASGLDIIVHLGRMRDHSRKVLEISEITGFFKGEIELQTLYSYSEKTGMLERKNTLMHTQKLQEAGYDIADINKK